MLRRTLCFAFPAALLAADPKPDFSGHWSIDLAKSDFGMMPPPEKLERDIDHKDPEIKIKTLQAGPRGERTTESKLTTNGKESSVQVMGRDAKSTAAWKGSKLNIKTKLEFNGAEILQDETWTLSNDGKVLTIENAISSPQGEFMMKNVFTKGS
jgi:hypothetical protein